MREFRIVARADGTVVKRIEISPEKSESQVEKLLSGLLRNLNTDMYYVEDSADDDRNSKNR
jgi:hypothetical protein